MPVAWPSWSIRGIPPWDQSCKPWSRRPGRSRWGLPSFRFSEFAQTGGLVGYGINIVGLFRRAASFVARILKGAAPADLPVERPTNFDLVINLKTAKALGVRMPPSLLARA